MIEITSNGIQFTPLFWIAVIIGTVINISIIVWIYEIREATKATRALATAQLEKMETREKIQLAQLALLASTADKLGVPVEDINEVVADFGLEYV